jgi:hypothetical protein
MVYPVSLKDTSWELEPNAMQVNNDRVGHTDPGGVGCLANVALSKVTICVKDDIGAQACKGAIFLRLFCPIDVFGRRGEHFDQQLGVFDTVVVEGL